MSPQDKHFLHGRLLYASLALVALACLLAPSALEAAVCTATTMAELRTCVASGTLTVGDEILLIGGGSPTTYATAGTPLDLPPIPNGTCTGVTGVTIKTNQPADIPAAGTQITAAQWARYPRITTSTQNASAIRVLLNGDCWRTDGVRVESTYSAAPGTMNVINMGIDASDNNATLSADLPNYVQIRHTYIACVEHANGGCARGIKAEATNLVVHDSYINNIVSNNQQSAGIGECNTIGPWDIQNNFLEATGQGILFGGCDPAIGVSTRISGVTFRYNYVTKDIAWLSNSPSDFINCNLFEIKNGENFTIEYNRFENSWSDCQSGGGILFTSLNDTGKCSACTISSVVFRHNAVFNVGIGMLVLGQSGYNRSDYSACNVAGPGNNVTNGTVESGSANIIRSITANMGDSLIGLTVHIVNAGLGVDTTRNIVAPWVGATTTGGISGATVMPTALTVDGAALTVGTGYTFTFQAHTVNSADVGCAESTRIDGIALDNVLMYDITSAFSGGANTYGVLQFSRRPKNLTIDHMTAVTTKGWAWAFADASAATYSTEGLTITNSILSAFDTATIRSDNDGTNKAALDAFLPGGYTWNENATSPAGTMPTGTTTYTQANLLAEFVNAAGDNYQITGGSTLHLNCTHSNAHDTGVRDWAAIAIALAASDSGHVIPSDSVITPPIRLRLRAN